MAARILLLLLCAILLTICVLEVNSAVAKIRDSYVYWLKMRHGDHYYKYKRTRTVGNTLWPNGLVPYSLSSKSQLKSCLIKSAMMNIMQDTCIQFREKNYYDDHYLFIYRGDDCSSDLGFNKYVRVRSLSIGKHCYYLGIVMHELMHALAFAHELSRSDRYNYVTINWENIEDGEEFNFQRLRPTSERLLSPFDFQSIMMYGPYTMSKYVDSPTYVTKDPNITVLHSSEKSALSKYDIESINLLYKCTKNRELACTKLKQMVDFKTDCETDAQKILKADSMQKLFNDCFGNKRDFAEEEEEEIMEPGFASTTMTNIETTINSVELETTDATTWSSVEDLSKPSVITETTTDGTVKPSSTDQSLYSSPPTFVIYQDE